MKKIISVIMSAAMAFSAAVPCAVKYNQSYASASSGISVEERTPQEIKQYVDDNPYRLSLRDSFVSNPSLSYPYDPGILSDGTLENALNAVNCMRYIAGLPEVSLNSHYNELAQAASLVNEVNGSLEHYPTQPSDMPDDIFNMGAEGAGSSNLNYSSWKNLSFSVEGYMHDSDPSNIARVGHRRWCLNPYMKETGFGIVNYTSAMYILDESRTGATEKGVCWPAQNMPVEYFTPKDLIRLYGYPAWSISMGEFVNESDIKVNLVRKSDSAEWNFSSNSADGEFYVDNSGCGQTGCIIFRPSDISYSAGDVFDVKIEGMEEPVEYTVNFFSLDDIPSEPVTYSFGDINADSEINANDASAVLAEYAAVSTNQTSTLNDGQKQAADINGDGKIDATDASTILAYYAYLSTGGTLTDMSEWFSQQ